MNKVAPMNWVFIVMFVFAFGACSETDSGASSAQLDEGNGAVEAGDDPSSQQEGGGLDSNPELSGGKEGGESATEGGEASISEEGGESSVSEEGGEQSVTDEGGTEPPPLDFLSVSTVTPNSGLGSGGEPVVIEGSGFAGDAQVFFGESLAENVYVIDGETISADTPPRPPGLVDVRVVNPSDDPLVAAEEVALSDAFVFYNPVSVSEIEPQQGPVDGGTPVSLKGTGFTENTKVLFGLKAAVNVEVLDDTTLLAVSPLGAAGATDIHVSNADGVGTLEKGFFYYEYPKIDMVSPPNGPVNGGNAVTLSGEGLMAGALIRIGGEDAVIIESGFGSEVTVKAPAGQEGPADVEVETGYGIALLGGGYTYYDPQASNNELVLLGVSPNHGSRSGGDDVFLTAYGLTDLAGTDVVFGEVSAEVISVNPLTKTAHVRSPEGAETGWVSVTLTTANGTGTIEEGFLYEHAVDVLDVSPGVGPVYGGSSVTILGSGFEPGAEVRIGALPAIDVTVVDESTIECITPPGSPGFVPVSVKVNDGEGVLDNAFFYQTDGMELYLVSPNQGSIAGATQVSLVGSGFPANAEVYVDGVLATHITVLDSTHISMKTPPGAVGTVDVEVVSPQGTASLPDSFTYFNPEAALGGTWGGEVDGDVNITVTDISNSAPIADAFVMLYTDPTTPYQGFTNLQGQITFSGEELVGVQMVSASKAGYETNSVIEFDAKNITIYLTPIPDPSAGTPPPGIGPPTVTGKLYGLDKYTIIPIGECSTKFGSPAPLCNVCSQDVDCQMGGSSNAVCVQHNADDIQKYCSTPCLAPSDCPTGFVCGSAGGSGAVCLPSPGQKVAKCFATKPQIFERDIWHPEVLGVPGPGNLYEVTQEGDYYTVYAYPGEVAVVCFGGYIKYNHVTQPNEQPFFEGFVPLTMGVARHVFTAPDQETPDKDIELKFMMDRDLTIEMDDPPQYPPDFQGLFTYMDFGTDGVIEMKHAMLTGFFGMDMIVKSQVREFTGDIYDASFTFLGGAFSNTLDNTPMALVLAKEVTSIEDDTIFTQSAGNWQGIESGVKENINGLWGSSESNIYGIGPAGGVYHYNGGSWTKQATDSDQELNDIFGFGESNILAVGNGGTVLRFDGFGWNEEPVPGTSQPLLGVWGASQIDVFAVGQFTVQHFDGQAWKTESLGLSVKEFTDVYGADADNVWITARQGWVYSKTPASGGVWAQVQLDHKEDLHAVWAADASNVFVVGNKGVVSHYNGIGWSDMATGSDKDLYAVWGSGPSDVYAVGEAGTILHYDGSQWADQTPLDYTNTLVAVWGMGPGHALATGSHEFVLSPFVDVPVPKYPSEGGVLTEYKVEFATEHELHPASFQYVNIQIPGMMGPTPCWLTVTEGEINEYTLPEFPDIEGTPGIPDGPLSMTILRVFKPGFSLDNYDYTDFNTLQWRAWSVDTINFTKQ